MNKAKKEALRFKKALDRIANIFSIEHPVESIHITNMGSKVFISIRIENDEESV